MNNAQKDQKPQDKTQTKTEDSKDTAKQATSGADIRHSRDDEKGATKQASSEKHASNK